MYHAQLNIQYSKPSVYETMYFDTYHAAGVSRRQDKMSQKFQKCQNYGILVTIFEITMRNVLE